MSERLGRELLALERGLRMFPNSALREPPGAARLVVGGPGHGQVIFSDQYVLRMARPRPFDWTPNALAMVEVAIEQASYSYAEVGVYGRIYRTWRLTGMDEDEHVMHAILACFDCDPATLASCRVDVPDNY